jgi:hypothetical protein
MGIPQAGRSRALSVTCCTTVRGSRKTSMQLRLAAARSTILDAIWSSSLRSTENRRRRRRLIRHTLRGIRETRLRPGTHPLRLTTCRASTSLFAGNTTIAMPACRTGLARVESRPRRVVTTDFRSSMRAVVGRRLGKRASARRKRLAAAEQAACGSPTCGETSSSSTFPSWSSFRGSRVRQECFPRNLNSDRKEICDAGRDLSWGYDSIFCDLAGLRSFLRARALRGIWDRLSC